MRLAIGSDERSHTTDIVISRLKDAGYELTLFGPLAEENTLWPEVAQQVAESVAEGHTDEGILFCWTGTGVSIAANKVPGIRAALCDDAETARGARLWNDANVLCLSLRRVSPVIAGEILDQWFTTAYQPNSTDDACLNQVKTIEEKYNNR
jgi:ribose 5-phosphate isomerase B